MPTVEVRPGFSFDARASDALARAPSEPDEAAKLLMLAAEYIRAGKPFPIGLDDYFACAFERAAIASEGTARNTALLAGLNLKMEKGPRPKLVPTEIGKRIERLMERTGRRKDFLAKRLAMKLGVSLSTVKAAYEEYKEAKDLRSEE